MTREEALRSYTPLERKATWVMMGSNKITGMTSFYNEGNLYKLATYSNYQDALIYCSKTVNGAYDWEHMHLIDENTGEITFGEDVISSEFTVILTPEKFEELDDNLVDKFIRGGSFVPFAAIDKETKVVITEDDYALCLKCLGYPFISESELEYTRSQITNLAIKPALQRYFKYFPKTMRMT